MRRGGDPKQKRKCVAGKVDIVCICKRDEDPGEPKRNIRRNICEEGRAGSEFAMLSFFGQFLSFSLAPITSAQIHVDRQHARKRSDQIRMKGREVGVAPA